jgi:hypothetical protein
MQHSQREPTERQGSLRRDEHVQERIPSEQKLTALVEKKTRAGKIFQLVFFCF